MVWLGGHIRNAWIINLPYKSLSPEILWHTLSPETPISPTFAFKIEICRVYMTLRDIIATH